MDINKITVIGSGVMGSGIAAHLVNGGFKDVNLLDIVPSKLTEEQIKAGYTLENKDIRNLVSRKNINNLLKSEPAQIADYKLSKNIKPGNTVDDLEKCVKESDWIIEVVPEVLKIKQDTFRKIDEYRNPDTIVTSNTSGLSIDDMINGCSEGFKEHFMVTHFFNPVRYMKLLELVKGKETKPEVVEAIQKIGEDTLGKGIVFSYDSPAFVGNRIGVFNIMYLMSLIGDYSIDAINSVFDKKLGYGGKPFSTCDLVGLDTMGHVVKDIYDRTNDECHDVFKLPKFVEKLISEGNLGRKTGAGFYKREKIKGKNVDSVIDPTTNMYIQKQKPNIKSLEEAEKAKSIEEAMSIMYDADDEGGEIYRKTANAVIKYSFARAPEISPGGIEGIDNAIKWGFNQKKGPGDVLDAVGVEKVVKNLEKEGDVPELLKELYKTGKNKVYIEGDNKEDLVFDKKDKFRIIEKPAKHLTFKEIAKRYNPITNVGGGGRLYDIEDGVLAFEMLSKGGTITRKLIDSLAQSLEIAKLYKGMVIGNDMDNFSFGANLEDLLGYILRRKSGVIESVLKDFQQLNQDIKYSPVPIVLAKKGLALGGGNELGYGANIRAALESYIGLVEFGVGLIPAGGGIKETLVNKFNKYTKNGELKPENKDVEPLSYIKETFEQIAFLKVAKSAYEAKNLGYLSEKDGISMNADFLLSDAKQDVIRLSNNYQPPKEAKVWLPGRDMRAAFYTQMKIMEAGDNLPPMSLPKFIKEEFRLVARTLGDILSGGYDTLPPGRYFTENELLKMEREGFLRLTTETSFKERFAFLNIAANALKKNAVPWGMREYFKSFFRGEKNG